MVVKIEVVGRRVREFKLDWGGEGGGRGRSIRALAGVLIRILNIRTSR